MTVVYCVNILKHNFCHLFFLIIQIILFVFIDIVVFLSGVIVPECCC